ncbi:MAG TPA: hypothetical protein VG937_10560 [Polyangiaceae bacterium]|nr:hypothetical protein [Polyangiaceae bacterium]
MLEMGVKTKESEARAKGKKKPCGPCSGSASGGKGDCGCGGCGSVDCRCGAKECCNLVCFERPNYFCGHLLTDADLKLDQKYLIEKNRLYHRTLHGSGVVCGLRLSCDSDCGGWICVGDGFAIDECGNDLVVCETLRYPLIDDLKKKGWVLEFPPLNLCDDEEEPPDCPERQCFYVTLCYDEVPGKYTSPLRSSCNNGPASCEPTRIQESVRVEIKRCPPTPRNPIEDIEERLEVCWSRLEESRFGKLLADRRDAVEAMLADGVSVGKRKEVCELFCQLKYLLGYFLKQNPALLHCHLAEELDELECQDDDFEKNAKDAFCKLFVVMNTWLMDCLLSALEIPCVAAPKDSCVVLGSVEVVGDRIERMCHNPRAHVWTLHRFWNLALLWLYHEIVLYAADREKTCCADYPFQCEQVTKAFSIGEKDLKAYMKAPIHAMKAFRKATAGSMNFLDPDVLAPSLLERRSPEEMELIEKAYQLRLQKGGQRQAVHPLRSLLATAMIPARARVNVEEGHAVIDSAEFLGGQAAKPAELAELEEAWRKKLGGLDERINELTEQLKRHEGRIVEVEKKPPKGKS